jgi:hypothetical protein
LYNQFVEGNLASYLFVKHNWIHAAERNLYIVFFPGHSSSSNEEAVDESPLRHNEGSSEELAPCPTKYIQIIFVCCVENFSKYGVVMPLPSPFWTESWVDAVHRILRYFPSAIFLHEVR